MMSVPPERRAHLRALVAGSAYCALFGVLQDASGQSLCDDFHVPAAHIGHVESCVFDNTGTTTVKLNAPAVLEWQRGFRVNRGQRLRFAFGDAGGTVLNRDTSGQTSLIAGQVSSDGRVMLINPGAGISIQSGAIINAAGGFLASTLDVSDEEALLQGGDVEFSGGGDARSAIDNRGLVRSGRGDIVLISRSVNNFAGARLAAPAGAVRVATGTRVRLFDDGIGAQIEVLEGDGAHPIINFGTIDGAEAVELAASGAPTAVDGAANPIIDNRGTIRTTAENGRVFLRARGGGQVLNSAEGVIDTNLLTLDADALINQGNLLIPDDGSNPAPPSGSRQFPSLSTSGQLAVRPTGDFRLSRLSFSHLNGLEAKSKIRRPRIPERRSNPIAVRGGGSESTSTSRTAKPAANADSKKVILRRGSFFGKKTS